MGVLSTMVLLAAGAFAAVSGGEPGLLADKELQVPLYPVALELEADGRIQWVRLAFVPFAHRNACHGRFLKECLELTRIKGIQAYARHMKEPGQVLDIKVGTGQRSLLGRLSASYAVKEMRGRVDVSWTAAGQGKEYPIDKRHVVSARVRWRIFANGEKLQLLEVLK